MSKRISKELDSAIKEYKSCYNCTNFKLKPFKFDKQTKQISIDFKLATEKVRCVKEMFSKLQLKSSSNIKSSINTETNKSIILRDSLKCPDRYKNISNICPEYDGEA